MHARLSRRSHGLLLPRPALGLRPGYGLRVLLFGLLGYAAGDLPVMLHGAPTFWIWSCLGALVGAAAESLATAWPAARCTRAPMAACMAAVSAGAAFDFMIVPPEAMVSLCSNALSRGMSSDLLMAHLRWFPATALAMLVLLAVPRLSVLKTVSTSRSRALLLMPVLIALEFCAMLVLMTLGMDALKVLAQIAGLPWTANGMVAAMMASMWVFFLLSSLFGALAKRFDGRTVLHRLVS